MGPTDIIALGGVVVGLLALVVAVWCVDFSLKRTLRVNTLIGIRDDVVKTLDEIETLLREIGDTDPVTGEVMQKISNNYWKAKHQFEASYQKASVVLSQKEIGPWSAALPKVDSAYARFAESLGRH